MDDTSPPIPVDFAGTWKVIEAGEYNTCGISSDEEVHCWGANGEGQLGQGVTGSDQLTPLWGPGLAAARHLAMGEFTVCVPTTFDVYCWGRNSSGQVGNGIRGGPVTSPYLVPSAICPAARRLGRSPGHRATPAARPSTTRSPSR